MSDLEKLKHLIRLVDDDSRIVRKSVAGELLSYGSALNEALECINIPADDALREHIRVLLAEFRCEQLREAWSNWNHAGDAKDQIEAAQSMIADFLAEDEAPGILPDLLDALAQEYLARRGERDPKALAAFLFKTKAMQGAHENYYDPRHSSLVYVIREKRGLPISLSCIYMLVGARLGIKIEGCNFPGHFLAQAFIKDEMVLVDCFNGGRTIPKTVFRQVKNYEVVKKIINRSADATTIVARILTNLIRAYRKSNEAEKSAFFEDLLKSLKAERSAGPGNSGFSA